MKGKSIELSRLFRDMIISGELKSGEKFPPIVEIAKRYETTIVTVSKAFDLLAEKKLIERHPGKGIYVGGKSPLRFAVAVDEGEDMESHTFLPTFLRFFREECRKKSAKYDVYFRIDDDESCKELLSKLKNSNPDVILIASRFLAEHHKKYLSDLLSLNIGLYPYKWLPLTLSANNGDIGSYGCEELFKRGCEKVFMIDKNHTVGNWSKTPFDNYCENFKAGLRRHNVLFDNKLLRRGKLNPKSGYDMAFNLLNENSQLKKIGIISTDSLLTMGILNAAADFQRHHSGLEINFVSHINQGSPLSEFSKNVICYITPVETIVDKIFTLSQKYPFDHADIIGDYIFNSVKKQTI